jgi:hypothetical protein
MCVASELNVSKSHVWKLRKNQTYNWYCVRISSATEKNQHLLHKRFCNKSQKKKENNILNIIWIFTCFVLNEWIYLPHFLWKLELSNQKICIDWNTVERYGCLNFLWLLFCYDFEHKISSKWSDTCIWKWILVCKLL